MPSHPWNTIWRLFEEAQSLPAGERSKFLDAQCSDPAVREEVDSLLVAYEEAPAFLDGLARAVVAPALDDLSAEKGDNPSERPDPLDREGTTVGRYAVEEYLGSGGMGVVYRARDTHLDRHVALKFLPPHLARLPEAEDRFVREARSMAALDHPNVATIHEIGQTDDGHFFIAMAYYAGETLQAKLAREGALPVMEAVAVTAAILKGLSRAHRAGVLHRDIKPANVMLMVQGTVKLLDFGLAQVVDQSRLTTPGRRLGTAAYMSPEQARGESVDARTDLWAVGVVLYEMLVGEQPFRGEREVSVLHAILHQEPPPIHETRSDVPRQLQAVVDRCLQKEAAARYDSAEALLADLEALRSDAGDSVSASASSPGSPAVRRAASGLFPRRGLLTVVLFVIFAAAASWAFWKGGPDEAPSVVWERSVAVLPFTHLGADDSTDYFSLGITEELLTRLARVSDLSVISRTSVMRYQDTHKSLREIGDELGVATIVEGSVQQVGDRVRIHAQLIDAETDRHLWGESYDRRLEDILAVQSEVAIHIAEALQAELLPNEQTQLTSRRDVDEAAYHLYLRALHLQDRREPAGIVKATQLLQDAIRQDSTFGPAYGSLALAYVWSGLVARMSSQAVDVTGMPPETAIPQALQTADRALALDSSVVEAHLARALAYNIFTREWEKSEQAFQRALAINPNHSETIQEYGRMLLRLGHVERALVQMRRAVALDPLSGTARMGLGYTYHCLRRYEDAIRELETALDLDNASPFTPKYLAHAHLKRAEELAQQGRTQEADARLQRAEEAMEMSWGPDSTRQRLFEYAVKGVSEEVLKILDGGNVSYGLHLWALLLADQRDAALDHINHNFTWGVFADPLFDPVRDDPRFEAIVEAKLERDVDLR